MISSTHNTTNIQAETILPDHAFENALKLADRIYIAITKFTIELDKELSDYEKTPAPSLSPNALKQIHFFKINLDALTLRSDKLLEKIEIVRASYEISRLSFEHIEERLAMAREGTLIDELQTKLLRLLRRKKRVKQQWERAKKRLV